jgi:hypothetical protein
LEKLLNGDLEIYVFALWGVAEKAGYREDSALAVTGAADGGNVEVRNDFHGCLKASMDTVELSTVTGDSQGVAGGWACSVLD